MPLTPCLALNPGIQKQRRHPQPGKAAKDGLSMPWPADIMCTPATERRAWIRDVAGTASSADTSSFRTSATEEECVAEEASTRAGSNVWLADSMTTRSPELGHITCVSTLLNPMWVTMSLTSSPFRSGAPQTGNARQRPSSQGLGPPHNGLVQWQHLVHPPPRPQARPDSNLPREDSAARTTMTVRVTNDMGQQRYRPSSLCVDQIVSRLRHK